VALARRVIESVQPRSSSFISQSQTAPRGYAPPCTGTEESSPWHRAPKRPSFMAYQIHALVNS
jgi:hypothetical protein